MDYFTKWPDVYAIPYQEASTVTHALLSNFFCCFGDLMKLHGDQ
jgi:hypothetical protein